LVRDRELGWLRRISTTPVHPLQLLGAQMALNIVFAAAAMVIIMVGATVIFQAPISVDIPLFILSAVLAIAEIFSLGLVVVALVSSQATASVVSGVLFFALMFLSGLWIQPDGVTGPLHYILLYSPSGAAVRALLYSVFGQTPLWSILIALVAYMLVFAFVAIRYFRSE
jgi:ABC-2 type transport system permease protein